MVVGVVCVDSVACAKNYRPESQLVWLIVNQFKSMEDMMRFAKICFGLAFLLPLLTEPSSHGVQDHQLGMFFFPLALPFFHLLFTPSKEQKRHLSSLSLSFTVGNLLEFQHLFDLSAG